MRCRDEHCAARGSRRDAPHRLGTASASYHDMMPSWHFDPRSLRHPRARSGVSRAAPQAEDAERAPRIEGERGEDVRLCAVASSPVLPDSHERERRDRQGKSRAPHGRQLIRARTRRWLLVRHAGGEAVRGRVCAAVSGGVRQAAHRDERGTADESPAAQRESTLGASNRHRGGSAPTLGGALPHVGARRARRARNEGDHRGDGGASSRSPACGGARAARRLRRAPTACSLAPR